jgi:ABC-type Na+ transport system ATPase subunit NatA
MIVINDKEVILRYINLLGEEILRDKKIAVDLDEKIDKIDIESKDISQREIEQFFNLMRKRIKIAKAIFKNHENIHKMIDYVAAEGYEVKWKEYTAIDLIKHENSKFGG